MARRVNRQFDEYRTSLLGQKELFVLKGQGDNNNYFAWLQDQEIDRCPFCGSEDIKVQDLFPKTYIDVVEENNQKKPISLFFQFYKYRCLNKECNHIFSKKIRFASQTDNITFRSQNEIFDLVIKGYSYSDISFRFSGLLSRQAVGQIFNRSVIEKEEHRFIKTPPSSIAIISGKTDRDFYTLILNLDDDIRIFDILSGVSSNDIIGKLQWIGLNNIKTVISDCNPTIVDTINDVLPNATYIIPIQYWFKLVYDDFSEYSHDILRWSAVKGKNRLILLPESELGFRTSDLNMLFETRPDIKKPYSDFNELRSLINNRENPWTITDVDAWTTHIDPDFRSNLETTILRLNVYKDLIYQHELNRTMVPDLLYTYTDKIEDIISVVKTFSDFQLKARVLYSVQTDLRDWRGVPIKDVINTLEEMDINRRNKRNEYE